jgi:hypothetical protein
MILNAIKTLRGTHSDCASVRVSQLFPLLIRVSTAVGTGRPECRGSLQLLKFMVCHNRTKLYSPINARPSRRRFVFLLDGPKSLWSYPALCMWSRISEHRRVVISGIDLVDTLSSIP